MTPSSTPADRRQRPARGPGDPARGADHRRIVEATRLWGLLTLGGVVLMAALVLWHLARRGRLLRERLGPPRIERLATPEPRQPDDASPTHPDETRT